LLDEQAAENEIETEKRKDPFLLALGKIWPTILLAYDDFKELSLSLITNFGKRLFMSIRPCLTSTT